MTSTEVRPNYREIAAAVTKARQVYCKPVADLVAEELMAWGSMGAPIGGHARIQRLVDAVMAEPDPNTGAINCSWCDAELDPTGWCPKCEVRRPRPAA